jgi:hypothetical protein
MLLIFNQALARGGYRCMISGMFDYESLRKNTVLHGMEKRDAANGVMVHVRYILNE